jgi:hypothetical protein
MQKLLYSKYDACTVFMQAELYEDTELKKILGQILDIGLGFSSG